MIKRLCHGDTFSLYHILTFQVKSCQLYVVFFHTSDRNIVYLIDATQRYIVVFPDIPLNVRPFEIVPVRCPRQISQIENVSVSIVPTGFPNLLDRLLFEFVSFVDQPVDPLLLFIDQTKHLLDFVHRCRMRPACVIEPDRTGQRSRLEVCDPHHTARDLIIQEPDVFQI